MKTNPPNAPVAQVGTAKERPKCDHICLLDDGHVDRGEPHCYGYELPSPRGAVPNAPTSKEAVSLNPEPEAQDNLSVLLSELEGKARAATPDAFSANEDEEEANAVFAAAASPGTVLALIEVARCVAELGHSESIGGDHVFYAKHDPGSQGEAASPSECPVCALARLGRSET